MPRPYTAKNLVVFLLVSAVFTALISPVSAASINYSSSADWNSGNFEDTRTSAEDLILGYDSGTAEDVDASEYSDVSGSNSLEWITGVEIKGISSNTDAEDGSYGDYTNHTSGALKPGQSYEVSVELYQDIKSSSNEYASIAFDWNNNQDLSDDGTNDGDKVYTLGACAGSPCEVSDTITIPENAKLNNSILMRVMGDYGEFHTSPTKDTSNNEIEDYSVFIPGYTDSGSYSTNWVNTYRLASWHNLSYSANISSETDGQLEVAVSEDGSTVQTTESFDLEDGNNTLNITSLESAPYIRVRPTLSTTNVKETPRIEGLQINHKLININKERPFQLL